MVRVRVPEACRRRGRGRAAPTRGAPRGYSERGSTETPRDLRRAAAPSGRASSRGATRLHRISTAQPRRRRDSSETCPRGKRTWRGRARGARAPTPGPGALPRPWARASSGCRAPRANLLPTAGAPCRRRASRLRSRAETRRTCGRAPVSIPLAAASPARLVSAEYSRRGRGVVSTRYSRRGRGVVSTEYPRRGHGVVSTEYPRRGRGGAAIPQRNIHVAATAAPRPIREIFTSRPRRRLHEILTSRPRRRRDPSEKYPRRGRGVAAIRERSARRTDAVDGSQPSAGSAPFATPRRAARESFPSMPHGASTTWPTTR